MAGGVGMNLLRQPDAGEAREGAAEGIDATTATDAAERAASANAPMGDVFERGSAGRRRQPADGFLNAKAPFTAISLFPAPIATNENVPEICSRSNSLIVSTPGFDTTHRCDVPPSKR